MGGSISLCGVPNDGLLKSAKDTEGLTRDETWDTIVNSTRNLLYFVCSVIWSCLVVMEQVCARFRIVVYTYGTNDGGPVWSGFPSQNR